MSKKIILLCDSGSVHGFRWASGLAERGLDISVITIGEKHIEGVNTINLPAGKSRSVAYFKHLRKVKRLIKELQPDLIHAHYAVGFGLWGYYSRFHPYLLSVWGSDIISFPSNPIKRLFLKRILSSADYLSATSNYLKNMTIQLSPQHEQKILVIPFGVNVPEKITCRKDDDSIRLVFIKMHEKIYGPDILFRAMTKVLENKPNVFLTMAGAGSKTAELKNLAKQLKIENNITFCGFIDQKKIASFLADFDIMVMPSLQESFGVAVLEASAVGLPVIAGDVGGVPEVLISEKTGILVSPGNVDELSRAIIRLAENADLRKRMGLDGRKMVAEKFRWEICLDKMSELYERLISSASRKG
jgi:glycosyltransferase involved in cell wall biosynthesis